MESALRALNMHGDDEDSRWAACIVEAEVGAPAIDIYTAASLGDVYVVREALERCVCVHVCVCVLRSQPVHSIRIGRCWIRTSLRPVCSESGISAHVSVTFPLSMSRSDPELAVARNDLGWSPLMFAVWQGHEGLVSTLVEAARRSGHDPTEDPAVGRLPRSGRSLLMVAARFGYVRIAAMLCKVGVGVVVRVNYLCQSHSFPDPVHAAQLPGDARLPRPDGPVPRRPRGQRGAHPAADGPGRRRQRLVSKPGCTKVKPESTCSV